MWRERFPRKGRRPPEGRGRSPGAEGVAGHNSAAAEEDLGMSHGDRIREGDAVSGQQQVYQEQSEGRRGAVSQMPKGGGAKG